MIGNFIAGLFGGLWFYLMLLCVGALIGVGAWLVGRFTGVSGAAAFGAVAILSAYVSGIADQASAQRAQAKVNALQIENAIQAKKIDEIKATNAVLEQSTGEAKDTVEHNAKVIADLNKALDAIGDKPDCTIPGDILDELDKLR